MFALESWKYDVLYQPAYIHMYITTEYDSETFLNPRI